MLAAMLAAMLDARAPSSVSGTEQLALAAEDAACSRAKKLWSEPRQWSEPPQRPPRPNMPPMPGEAPGNGNDRAYRRAVDKETVRDKQVQTATVFGAKREGVYTGELVNGKPDGSGELVLPSTFAKLGDDSYNLSEERVKTLKRKGASDEALRAARAEVERLAAIPRERYDEVWESIKAYARSKGKSALQVGVRTQGQMVPIWGQQGHGCSTIY